MMPTTGRLRIGGRRPPMTDAAALGRLVRRALIARAAQAIGWVPATLTARTADDHIRTDGHRHAFFLSEDADDDGFIDHMVIHVPEGIEIALIRGIDNLSRVYTAGADHDWPVLLEGIGPAAAWAATSSLLATAAVWRSVTPYYHPWHRKRHGRFGPEDQLRRELATRGLPEPVEVVPVPYVVAGGRPLPPGQFRRVWPRGGGTSPDPRGGFWQIVFPEPVTGPLALGDGCHYGLGVFAAQEEGRSG